MLDKKQKFISFVFFLTMFFEALMKNMLPVFFMLLVALALLILPNWFYISWRDKKRNMLATKKRNDEN